MSVTRPSMSGKMMIHLPGVIKTLGESLYSDPSVAIRELIQNAHDSCVVRKVENPSAPDGEIHIRIDAWQRTLVIEDNGAGMTNDEIVKFLTVIGSSHTEQVRARLQDMGEFDLAERLIGRFGLGLLSAFVIGDSIEFVTLSSKPGAAPVWWVCDGGQEYRIGPGDGRNTPGTSVTVHISPNHVGLLRHDTLTHLIHLFADFLPLPIILDPEPSPVNAMGAPWHRQATDAEYRQFVADRYPNDEILDVIPIEINEDNGRFKVGGVLFVPKQPLFIVKEHGDVTVYVRRMLVCNEERTLLPAWAKFVKGIVESPNLRETTSREALVHDEDFLRVQKRLGKVILDHLTRVSEQTPRLFREIVTSHNVVIKSWAIASNELFDRIKDIVLFETDMGPASLGRYFEMTGHARNPAPFDDGKRRIFYFNASDGAGQYAMLFAAKGFHVIDAQYFPDSHFLEKYADRHDDVVLVRLDVGGGFIFEDLDHREKKWTDLEVEYTHNHIAARVVRFVPENVPAVLVYPEPEAVADHMKGLLADPDLGLGLKALVRKLWQDRAKGPRHPTVGGVLYVNANNPVVQKLVKMDLVDPEIQEVMVMIHNNALMLSAPGGRTHMEPDNAKRIFDGNNRALRLLIDKICRVRELEAHMATLQAGTVQAAPAPEERPSSQK